MREAASALEAARAGDWEAAVDAWMALADGPEAAPALVALRVLATEAGAPAALEAALPGALAAAGEPLALAAGFLEAGEAELAAAFAAEGLGREPVSLEAALLLGRALLGARDAAGASAAFERAALLSPEEPAARWGLAEAALFAGDRAAARARLAALWPEVPEAAERLGELDFAEGDAPAAAKRFEAAHRAGALSPEGHEHWGFALMLAGEPAGALAAFEAGAAVYPGDAGLHSAIATQAEGLGRFERAREAWRALLYFPDRRAAAEEALERLAGLADGEPPAQAPRAGTGRGLALPGRAPATGPLLPRPPEPPAPRRGTASRLSL